MHRPDEPAKDDNVLRVEVDPAKVPRGHGHLSTPRAEKFKDKRTKRRRTRGDQKRDAMGE